VCSHSCVHLVFVLNRFAPCSLISPENRNGVVYAGNVYWCGEGRGTQSGLRAGCRRWERGEAQGCVLRWRFFQRGFPDLERDFDLAVIIYEKFRYFRQSAEFLSGVGEVVIDELEMISREGRGPDLELLLTGILTSHPEIAVTCLSRPFTNSEEILGLLGQSGRQTFHVQAVRRPFAIDVGIWEPRSKTILFTDCNESTIREEAFDLPYPGDILGTLRGLLVAFLKQTESESADGHRNNIVLACPTKRDNLLISTLMKKLFEEDSEIREILESNSNVGFISDRLRSLEPSQRKLILQDLLPKGIAVHDADLSPDERKLVSRSFRDREIPVLISSQTMAYGVNLPAQTIIFLGWGTRPQSGSIEVQHSQYVVKLQEDFVTWLGRVGRYGQRQHRMARAVYLCGGGKDTEEYRRIASLIAHPVQPINPLLALNLESPEVCLSALKSVQHKVGGGATWDEIEEIYASFSRAAQKRHLFPAVLSTFMSAGGLSYNQEFADFSGIVKRPTWPDKTLLDLLGRMLDQIPKRRLELKRSVPPARAQWRKMRRACKC